MTPMVAPRNVPIHPLSDYGTEMSAGQQFFIGRFEHSISNKPNRLRLHRHTYYEVFWVDGRGSFFANFGNISLRVPGSSSLAPGQVHRWNQKPRITGPMICFTQDCKGTAAQLPARSSFWFSFESLQLLTIAKGDAATFDLL
jgi:AraC family transcriptional regulator, transcriptional activator of pobA